MNWFPYIFKGKKTSRQHTVDEVILGIENAMVYSYKELRNATSDFDRGNIISQDSFGSIYKGMLKDGTVVAIKVMSISHSVQVARDFLNEITNFANLVHENLVKLYGCCVNGDQRIIVYQYLMNGSLAEALFGENRSNIKFNWRRHTRICIGIARGIAFLHEEVRPRIIHRDIKASNILLDKDLTPKISGCDLSKLLPEGQTHLRTMVVGTIGYLDPDYAETGIVRPSSDVYSFGVLLLEIVSGRRYLNLGAPYEEQLLRDVVWELYKRGELLRIVDPTLTDDLNTEEACKFLKIGLLCTQDAFELRPLMSKVVQMLIGERDVDSERITGDRIGSENGDVSCCFVLFSFTKRLTRATMINEVFTKARYEGAKNSSIKREKSSQGTVSLYGD